MPLFVRAGSILPLGPDMEWATEKPADPIELRVYRGADGDFTLYEDENDNYNYEKGASRHHPVALGRCKADADHRRAPRASFPGMLQTRTFHVVFAGENHGAGIAPETPDKTVQYSGEPMTVTP